MFISVCCYGWLVLLVLGVHEIHEGSVLQLCLVLLDILGNGIGGTLVGIVDSLNAPLGEGVVAALIHGHTAGHGTAGDIIDGLPERGLGDI